MAITIDMAFVQLIFSGLYYLCVRAVSFWTSKVAPPKVFPLQVIKQPPNPASLSLAQDNLHDGATLMDFNGPLTNIMEEML
jgi:hypothetical protein